MGRHLPPPPSLGDDASLFLDLDGTIVEVAPEPAAIVVDEDLRRLLLRIQQRLAGRLAILTGRSLANMDCHLDMPELAAAGSHGLERRRADGSAQSVAPSDQVEAATEAVQAFAEPRGLVVERKPGGVAVHYRQHPAFELAVTQEIEAVGKDHGLDVQEGSMVRELRLPGPDKGDALNSFMRESPFSSGRPIAVGDDLTDDHAFKAATALGGFGILIGDREGSAAQYGLRNVAALRTWLGETR